MAKLELQTEDVISSLPPVPGADDGGRLPARYRGHQPCQNSRALVLYATVRRDALPADCPGHLQRMCSDPVLTVSISRAETVGHPEKRR